MPTMTQAKAKFLLFTTSATMTIAVAAAEPTLMSFSAKQEYGATVTLLPKGLSTGRSNPIFNNYRPQLSFAVGTKEVTCAIHIPDPPEKIEPGQTTKVAVNCIEPFKAAKENLSFSFFEAGRKVGEGVLQP